MACCDCESTGQGLARSAARSRVLWTVLGIDLAIFVGQFPAGPWADSTALQVDSVDSLGDAPVYAPRLWAAMGQAAAVAGETRLGERWQHPAPVRGGVIVEVRRKLVVGAAPLAGVMAITALTQ